MTDKPKKRGLGSMTRVARQRVSRLGGLAAHEQGKAHEWTPEEARIAGRLGGRKAGKKRRGNPEDQTDE